MNYADTIARDTIEEIVVILQEISLAMLDITQDSLRKENRVIDHQNFSRIRNSLTKIQKLKKQFKTDEKI